MVNIFRRSQTYIGAPVAIHFAALWVRIRRPIRALVGKDYLVNQALRSLSM